MEQAIAFNITRQLSSKKLLSKKFKAPKPPTFLELTPFFNSLLRKKVRKDATFGFDSDRTMSLDQFTFQEFMALGNGDVMTAKKLMGEYMDTL